MAVKGETNKIILTGLMMAMITIVTMILPIPIPFTTGYIHLGDTVIFLSVLLLGWKYGAVAAGLGSALADLLIGFAIWAPWTLVIKGGMGLIMGLFIARAMKNQVKKHALGLSLYSAIGMILAGLFMVAGYYIAESIIYNNYIAALLGIPWNIGQFVVGLVLASLISTALYKTPAYDIFTYKPKK